MNDRVLLDMNAGEAILLHGALAKESAAAMRTWRELVTSDAPAPEQAAALVAAQVLSRVEARLTGALYPACEWFHDDCDRPRVAGSRYCRFHLDAIAGTVPVFSA